MTLRHLRVRAGVSQRDIALRMPLPSSELRTLEDTNTELYKSAPYACTWSTWAMRCASWP
jgi:hypothetical protein